MKPGIVNSIKAYGFSRTDWSILTSDELAELADLTNKLFMDPSVVKDYGSNAPVITDYLGQNPRIDFLLEKIFGHPEVQETLIDLLGADYKIWEISVRRSLPGDKGLGMHQDGPGQVNLVFALDDNLNGHGATAFLAGSHYLKRRIETRAWAPVIIASRILTTLKLSAGKVAIFANRTWHIRRENKSNESHDVVFFASYPAGATYIPIKSIQNNIDKWENETLRNRLDVGVGAKPADNNKVMVLSTDGNNEIPYTMQLESDSLRKSPNGTFLLTIYDYMLQFIFFLPLHFYRMFRA